MRPPIPEIYSLAVDLKLPADGPVQILEIMSSHIAGSTGYTYATGGDMTRDHILPALRVIAPNERIVQPPYAAHLPQIGTHYGEDIHDRQSGVIYPERKAPAGNGLRGLSRTDLIFVAENPQYRVVNASMSLEAVQNNKAMQSLIVSETPGIAGYFPPTVIVPSAYKPGLSDNLIQALPSETGMYVIKPVEEVCGNGVRIVDRRRLDAALQKILRTGRLALPVAEGVDYWHSDINPVFLVQPYIPSAPVMHDGSIYDGTLRVFMTLHRPADDEPFMTIMHDGYWKLPLMPADAPCALLQNRMISLSTPPERAYARLNKVFSAAMTDGQRDWVYPDLEQAIPAFLAGVTREPLHWHFDRWIDSGNAVHRSVGAMMAADTHCYPAPNMAVPSRRGMTAAQITSLGDALRDDPDGSLRFYFQKAIERKQPLAMPSEVTAHYVSSTLARLSREGMTNPAAYA